MAEQEDDPDESEAVPINPPRLPSTKPVRGLHHPKKYLRQLTHMVYCLARDRRRFRELVLLKERPFGVNGARKRARSEVRRHDRPEIELVLYRAEEVVRLEALVKAAESQIHSAGLSGAEFAEALASIADLNTQKMRHLKGIDDSLATLSKENKASEVIAAKLASDMAHIEQSASQHQDKMELAAKAVRPASSNDMKLRLAEKYGVSPDEVERMLAAKPVEHDPER